MRLIYICGGEDGIRTHAALANPNDLANRPLQPLEYFSVHNTCGGEGGIRTHGGLTLTGFQDQHHKPLGHLSLCYMILLVHRFHETPTLEILVTHRRFELRTP